MPELPEVEITARLLHAALESAAVREARAAGISTLKTFDPPLTSLSGTTVRAINRRGKIFIIAFSGDLSLMIHLMSAGRLQLFDKLSSVKDRTSRLLITFEDGRQLRLREFGTKQSAWAKLVHTGEVQTQPEIAKLGPEAWPDLPNLTAVTSGSRPLYTVLRDQTVLTGIGRSWIDEILHAARLSPFKRADSLDASQIEMLRTSIHQTLERAITHYEEVLTLPIPDKLPMPLSIHGHAGSPCPVCATKIEAVFFEGQTMCYCPARQTGGKLLKDRRLSRLIK